MKDIYIDIHTHHSTPSENTVSYKCTMLGVESIPNDDAHLQIGFHPWYLDHFEDLKSTLTGLLENKRVQFIGECGLDKVKGADWDVQLKAFEFQVQLAEQYKIPLIIHCVKAYNEVLQVLKTRKVRVIFHGFQGTKELAQQIARQGYFLSFGQSILHRAKSKEALKSIPIQQLFLETDEATVSISSIYDQASSLLQITIHDLIQSISRNLHFITHSSC